jgi:hypothetical protein
MSWDRIPQFFGCQEPSLVDDAWSMSAPRLPYPSTPLLTPFSSAHPSVVLSPVALLLALVIVLATASAHAHNVQNKKDLRTIYPWDMQRL